MKAAIIKLAKQHGFTVSSHDAETGDVTVLRYGIEPFYGSIEGALAYLMGWDRCVKNEGRS